MKIFRHFITIFFLIANVEIKIFNIEKRALTKQLRRKSQKSNAVKIVFTFFGDSNGKRTRKHILWSNSTRVSWYGYSKIHICGTFDSIKHLLKWTHGQVCLLLLLLLVPSPLPLLLFLFRSICYDVKCNSVQQFITIARRFVVKQNFGWSYFSVSFLFFFWFLVHWCWTWLSDLDFFILFAFTSCWVWQCGFGAFCTFYYCLKAFLIGQLGNW